MYGYSIGADQWSKEIHVPQTIEGTFAKGGKEMIVVLPGLKDRPQRIDVLKFGDHRRLRAIHRTRRGLVGHSMGGYGATRIGMKHADVFGSLYIMSP